jgi:hypothetical protein
LILLVLKLGIPVALLYHRRNKMNTKNVTIIGAASGLALFLAVALLPALLYGGYAGVLLAGGIFGTPVQATFATRALIVFGMVMGTCGIGALFTVSGAVVGAAVGALVTRQPASPELAKEVSREG